MKLIPLTQDESAIIDDEDFERVSQYKWYVCPSNGGHTTYVLTGIYNSKRKKNDSLSLHRFIMNAPKGMVVDHINGNGLDNRKSNLRIVTHSENCNNRTKINKNNTSNYPGVYWINYMNKWGVQFKKDYKKYYFGSYTSKEDAIRVAKKKRQELFNL